MSSDASIYDNLPMTHRMALMLLQRAGQPNPSWGGAIGNALAAGLGGYFEGQDERQAIQGKADVNNLFAPGAAGAPPGPIAPPLAAPPLASAPPDLPAAPPSSQANLASALMQRGQDMLPTQQAPVSNLPPTGDNAANPAPDQGDGKGPLLTGNPPPASVIANRFGGMAPPSAAPPVAEAPPGVDRSAFADELAKDPRARQKLLAISLAENQDPQANLAVMETMANRAQTRGTPISVQLGTGAPRAPGAYYPTANYAALSNPQLRAMAEDNLTKMLGGSNVSNLATDNASNQPGNPLAYRDTVSGRFIPTGAPMNGEHFFRPGTAGWQKEYALAFGSPQNPQGPPGSALEAVNQAAAGTPAAPARIAQGPTPPQSAPQPAQGQVGGFTPQVLQTLRGYAADPSNPARAGEAQKFLDHYNSLVATPHQQFQTLKTPTGDVPVFIDTNKGTMTKAELPGGATLGSLTGDPNVAGPEYLQTMPDPGRRKMVEAIGTGQMPYPSARMNPQANSIIGEVRQAFPNSTAEDYPNRLKADNAFTVGKEGQALKSTRQAIGHSLELATMQDKLEQYFSDKGVGQFPNNLYTFIHNNTDPEFKQLLSAYNNLAQKVGIETEKSALGGKPPAGDAKSVVASLDLLNGPSAARGALQGNAQFLAENSNALHEQYNTRTPNLPPRAPPDFLNEREQYGIRSLRETGRFDPSQAPPVPVKTPDEAYRYPSGTRILMPNGQLGVVPQFKPGGR